MKIIDRATSNRIANLGLICAAFVVLIHTRSILNSGSWHWWVWRFLSFRGIAVPTFMMISGFLLAGKCDCEKWWRESVTKRVRSLLIPFFVWGLLWLSCVVVFNIIFHGKIGIGCQQILQTFGIHPFMHPLLGSLWYVRALFILVLLSPIFCRLLRWNVWFTLAMAFSIYFFYYGYRCNVGNWKYFVCQFCGLSESFFFLMGMAIRMERVSIEVKSKYVPWLLCVLGIAMSLVAPFWGKLFFGKFAKVVMIVAIWNLTPTASWPRELTSLSFPIYLMHLFFEKIFSTIFYVRPKTCPQIIFKFVCVFLATAFVAWAIRKLFPRTKELLFGGR